MQICARAAEVEQILADQFAQLPVCLARGCAADREDGFNAVVAQAFPQNALSNHSRSSEKDYLHRGSLDFRRSVGSSDTSKVAPATLAHRVVEKTSISG